MLRDGGFLSHRGTPFILQVKQLDWDFPCNKNHPFGMIPWLWTTMENQDHPLSHIITHYHPSSTMNHISTIYQPYINYINHTLAMSTRSTISWTIINIINHPYWECPSSDEMKAGHRSSRTSKTGDFGREITSASWAVRAISDVKARKICGFIGSRNEESWGNDMTLDSQTQFYNAYSFWYLLIISRYL